MAASRQRDSGGYPVKNVTMPARPDDRLGELEPHGWGANEYRGRYQISVKPQGYQQAVTVKLVNLGQAGKPVADAASLQRYSTEMMNVISAGLNKTATDTANAAQNQIPPQR